MAETTKIQWTDHTFNPWRGCAKISAGCRNCYADVQSKRNPQVLGLWGPNGSRVVASEAQWREPLKWDKAAEASGERRRVFCASMADVFEDWPGHMVDSKGDVLWQRKGTIITAGQTTLHNVYGETPASMGHVRLRLFDLIDRTPNLDWLLLTKRPENISRMTPQFFVPVPEPCRNPDHFGKPSADCQACRGSSPPAYRPNVWLGTSVENQAAADERIPHLLAAPARIRFLSCEPLLEPVRLTHVRGKREGEFDAFTGRLTTYKGVRPHPKGVDWVIVGGESGHGARSFDLAWARSLVAQCRTAGVPCFVKQLGERPVTTGNEWGRTPLPMLAEGGYWLLKDRKGGDPAEWPEHLRVREFPVVS